MSTFRFIDLLTSIGCGVAILGLTVAARQQAQADVKVVACAKNLQQIAQSLVMYEGVYQGQFPRTRYTPDAPLAAYTQPDAPDPFADQGPQPNDLTASPFLLARTMDLQPTLFICPAAQSNGYGQAASYDRAGVKQRSNFRSRLNLNYSFANMYPDTKAVSAGYSLDHFRERLPVEFVLAADLNPGEKITTATTQASPDPLRIDNSPNHERDGENVLYTDGSVHFMVSPYVGVNGDNVYGGRPDALQPASATDSVLLPVWSMGPQLTPETTVNRRWFLSISMIVTLALLGGIVWKGLHRPKAAN
ncbi:MAG: hypothetical protein ACTHM6_04975 [Tepidisphaeraceae bacterium]